MTAITIERGHIYLVELHGIQMRLRAVEESRVIPGWWTCTAALGTEIMVPGLAFRSECGDISDGSQMTPTDRTDRQSA